MFVTQKARRVNTIDGYVIYQRFLRVGGIGEVTGGNVIKRKKKSQKVWDVTPPRKS